MNFDAIQSQLVNQLSDGQWHSGQQLAEDLGMSREALSKRVQRLNNFGLHIEKKSGRGYCLQPALQLLDEKTLQAASPIPLSLLPSVDSSNRWVQEKPAPYACLAEHQSAGRGRRGRQWVSPFGQNLYLSVLWEYPHWPAGLESLSLVIGVCLAQRLHQLGVPAQLKWPNDIYLQGKKCGGMLIEQTGEAQGPCRLVVGLGLNVAMQHDPDDNIDQAWVSLSQAGYEIDRQALASALLKDIVVELQNFSRSRVQESLLRFPDFDLFLNQPVAILQDQERIEGIARGIDNSGRLKLEDENGRIQHYSVGDVSLRAST